MSKEKPSDNPRRKGDKGSLSQTDKPWEESPEKEQRRTAASRPRGMAEKQYPLASASLPAWHTASWRTRVGCRNYGHRALLKTTRQR
jgi:hypothetical protein